MLKIRMQRTGRINTPSYRIVVVEHTEGPKTGNVVEKVGTYNPKTKERVLNAERIKYWMSVGAKPSDTVHNMLVSLGILNAKKINVLPKYKEPAPAVAPDSAKATTGEEGSGEAKKEEVVAPAETPAEVPAEEAKPEEPVVEKKTPDVVETPAA
ncbi:MAG: 30S ribosomal protein S16 [bacterium]|nr:30S ribosomal protein S16 [bacterium]